ncbi:MAG TPA: TonB-dependent receptor [Myxococcota bacterium]|nr:TonB-dependent receptor [Myxococcota bacterium]
MSSRSPRWRRRARPRALRPVAALAGALLLLGGVASAQTSDEASDESAAKSDAATAQEQAPAEAPEAEPKPPPENEPARKANKPTEPGAEEGSRTPETELPSGVEVIHVIGQQTEEAIQPEIAAAVTQFDAEALQALGAQNVSDLSAYTPNLEIKTAGATAPTFFIRGVGLNDFAANGSGAVAVYQDDVPRNAPANQLGQLFDMENVQVEKGPQGGGPARNASAGVIRITSKKPDDELGATLRSSLGNYNYQDYEGAINVPIVEDQLSTRLAFRFSERDPILTNRCSRIPFIDQPPVLRAGLPFIPATSGANALAGEHVPPLEDRRAEALAAPRPASNSIWNQVSFCGEQTFNRYPNPGVGNGTSFFPFGRTLSALPGGLDDKVNDMGQWSARGTVKYTPPDTNMEWLFNAHGSELDQTSTLGQAIGTANSFFGGSTALPYRDRDVVAIQTRYQNQGLTGDALAQALAQHLAQIGDQHVWQGDYDRTGNTRLQTWGGYANGTWNVSPSVTLTSVTGYDAYDRYRNTDQDFTPNVLFEAQQTDNAWQATQDLRASGELSELPVRWQVGGFTLNENLNNNLKQYFKGAQGSSLTPDEADLDYRQLIYSVAGYAGAQWDFAEDFTLDVAARYNWEQKLFNNTLTFVTLPGLAPVPSNLTQTWQSPTGSATLKYQLFEDTSVYWKYTHGWKGGMISALAQATEGVTVAKPEKIDAFEMGLKGNWLDSRLSFSGAIFYYKYQDYQTLVVQDTVAGPPGIAIINANDAEIYGADVDLRVEPIEALVFTGHFGWLESQYLDFTNTVTQSVPGPGNTIKNLDVTVDYTGNRLPNSPEFKLSGSLEYTTDLGRYGSLVPRFDFAWSDDIFFDPAEGRGNPNPFGQQFLPRFAVGQPAFWLLNARLSYRTQDGKFEIGGWVRNFMDTTYKTYGFDASQFSNVVINYYGDPRTYGMDLTVSF